MLVLDARRHELLLHAGLVEQLIDALQLLAQGLVVDVALDGGQAGRQFGLFKEQNA